MTLTATPTPRPRVDTAKVTGRRTLRFRTPAEMHADVAELVAAERAARLDQIGNWTLAQNLNHLGTWVNFAFDGTPLRPPWIIKLILRARKKQFLGGALPAGRYIPRVQGGTLGFEPIPLEEALEKFSQAWDRFERQIPPKPHIVFGPLAHQEWIDAHLRHAELHLSFLKPA
jgi:hypothetical protein